MCYPPPTLTLLLLQPNSASFYEEANEPSVKMVAARIAAITAATALPLIGWAGVAAASGMTSTQGVYKKGVYADNKLLVVKGEWHGCRLVGST